MANQQEVNGTEEVYLYDPEVLTKLNFADCKKIYKNGVSPTNPGEGLIIRPLALSDFDKGYMQLLQQLTKVGDVPQEKFEDRFRQMKSCPDTYYIVVIEDTTTTQVIGSASLIKEQKFIHGASARARVEDVVVSDLYRGKQLGKVLLDVLLLLSKEIGCYKISLECKDPMVQFYSLFDLKRPDGQNYMEMRYFD
ncbi:putative glucosamine 6-phosphate N-acetyltransferase [Babylonia areolata]|uniref:putative glucosamine 6-phosphate N-acetyltransferase n=1 Tax=Babylonia areolata TaxID=304850 RepID=UPI003FD3FAC1